MFEEALEEPRHAGQDVDVAVDDGDGHPHVVCDEDSLLLEWDCFVVWDLHHAQFGCEAWGRGVPVEGGLEGVGL